MHFSDDENSDLVHISIEVSINCLNSKSAVIK